METLLRRSWWMLAWRGAAAIAFGVLALIWPGATLLVLVALFAAFAFITGASSVLAAVRHRHADHGWWLPLLLGLVSIVAGVIAVARPGITAFVLVLLIGANAIVTGVLDVVMAIRLRRQIVHEWLLVVVGAVSVIFGAMVMAFPAAGALAIVWLVSFYALVTGVLLVALAIRLRSHGTPSAPAAPGHTGTPAGAH